MSTTSSPESPAPAPAPAFENPDAALPPDVIIDPAPRDAHGHDPAACDWVPVLRKRRADGWSPDKQRAFVAALAATGSVTTAAQIVGLSASSAYRLRRALGSEGFSGAWDAALGAARRRRIRAVPGRTLHGHARPILYRGQRVGERRFFDNRLVQYLLRMHDPGRYGLACTLDDEARYHDAVTAYLARRADLAAEQLPEGRENADGYYFTAT